MNYLIDYKIPYANLTYKIPAEGVVFRSDPSQGAPVLLTRVGGSLVTLDPSKYSGNYESLPTLTVTGEMENALSAIGGPRIIQGTPEQFTNLTPKTNETITQSIAPSNPYGISVTSSVDGKLSESPSLVEALVAGGATQEQAQQLAKTATDGRAFTIAELTSAGIPLPTAQTIQSAIGQSPVIGQSDYQFKEGETPEQYNERISQLRGESVLTPAQQEAYYKSQNGSKTPLSPAQWLAQQGQVAAPGTPAPTGTATPGTGTGTGTPGAAGTVLPNTATKEDQQLLSSVLNNPDLTDDQRRIIQEIYKAASTNDVAAANRFLGAFNASTQYSSPFFKAQIGLVADALKRTLGSNEGDLSFKQNQIKQTLTDLQKNTSASLDHLDLTEAQELKNLELSLKNDLETNAQNLAATGKTASSVRARTDNLLKDNSEGLVESTKRKFSFQTGNLTRALGSAEGEAAQQLAYLTDKTTQARIAALRETESKIGSDALSNLGYGGTDLFGNLFGSLPTQQYDQAITAGRTAISSPSFIF